MREVGGKRGKLVRANWRRGWVLGVVLGLLSAGGWWVAIAAGTGWTWRAVLTGPFTVATPTPTPKPKAPRAAGHGETPDATALSAGPVLAETDFALLGLAATASPATQTVPKHTATLINTSLAVPPGTDPTALIASLNPAYRVRGELVGPSLATPLPLEAALGQPLSIPPLAQAGDHAVQNLRVVDTSVSGQPTVLSVLPEVCGVVVIEPILVSEVRVNPLTYEQILQSGINLSPDSYNFFNFTLALATTSGTQQINIPAAFPPVGANSTVPVVGTPALTGPGTAVPDIVPVLLSAEDAAGQPVSLSGAGGSGTTTQIPGVIVFPGRIGLLHQFFEAILIVANGAPTGTPLVVRDVSGRIRLPDNGTPDETDDPLRIATTQTDGRVTQLALHGLGADNTYGTGDDTTSFAPGQAGQATFLLEGWREGLHQISFDIEGRLEGLPIGPVRLRGAATGAVLVRDASFSVTFTHPSVVRAGQEYDLGLTLYNSGTTLINGSQAELARQSIIGATLLGDATQRQFQGTLRPGETATVKWRLRANVTGQVTAAYAKVGDNIGAGLNLVTGVGDRNVPLSPDSLILPDEVTYLPPSVVERAREVLGQAWSIANAPAGGLPASVSPISKRTVIDRAVELGVAGLRVEFGETVDVSLPTFCRDWLGELQTTPSVGFGDALRNTPAGYRLFDSLGAYYSERLSQGRTPAELMQEVVATEGPRSPLVAALVSQPTGAPLLGARLVEARGKRVGYGASEAERLGELSTAAGFQLGSWDAEGHLLASAGQMLLASRVSAENWTLEITGWQNGTTDIMLAFPGSGRSYRRISLNGVSITAGGRYRVVFRPTATNALVWQEWLNGAWQNVVGVVPQNVVQEEAAPRVVGAVQVTPEVLSGGDKYGRLVGVLFSKPMARTAAETASRYTLSSGTVAGSSPVEDFPGRVSVARARLDLGARFVFMSLDKPVGPLIERRLSVSGVADQRGQSLPVTETALLMRASPNGNPPGAFATGRVLNAEGTPVANAQVFYQVQDCEGSDLSNSSLVTVAVTRTDAAGRYYFDYVRGSDCGPAWFTAVHPQTQSVKTLAAQILFHGQRLALDFVFLARGSVRGTVLQNNGLPAVRARVQVIPALDFSTAKVVETDNTGQYEARDLAVGNVSVKAVAGNASGLAAGVIAGPGQTATINVSLQSLAGAISGRVTSADGAPLSLYSAYQVSAYARIPGFGAEPVPVAYTQAASNGEFQLVNLPTSEITVRVVEVATLAAAQQTVWLTPASPFATNILLSLPGRGSISGQVLDDAGQAVPQAEVRTAGRAVRADSNGFYTCASLPEGWQTLAARDGRNGLAGQTSIQVRVGETIPNVNIFIARPGTLTGTVYRRQNGVTTPAAGVLVSPDGVQRVTTNAQGQYTISGVAANTALTVRFVDVTRKLAVNTPTVVAAGATVIRNAVLSAGTLHGRITQPDGTTPTVAQVQVNYSAPSLTNDESFGLLRDDAPVSLQTGADGLYALPSINVGAFRVTASNAFFPAQVTAGGTLAAEEDKEVNLSLTDTQTGKIQGRIYQPDGVTLAGAGVQVTLSGGSLAAATVVTDAAGYYEFAEIFPAGNYFLTATAPITGYTNRSIISAERNRDVVTDIRLRGRGAVRVRVLDGASQPAQRGSLNLNAKGYPNEARYQELSPGQGGVVTFEGLTEGEFVVSAQQNGLGGRGTLIVQRDMTVELVLQLQASGTIEGRVFQADGVTPVGLADVTLTRNGQPAGFTITADDESGRGRFSFSGVPTDDFVIAVLDNRTGRAGRGAGRLTQQGETATVNINLLAAGTVSGRVTANDVPVNHALVTISAEGAGFASVTLRATTDTEGRYRFYGIPAGSFTVVVTDAPGGQSGAATGQVPNVAVPPETVADVALAPTVTVTGTVYRFGGVEPVGGARVNLTAGGQDLTTFADAQGVYRLAFVPMGNIRARAVAPSGYERGESPTVTAQQPGATLTLNVTLAGVGNVTGNALDNNGTPLTLGTVTLTNSDWGSPAVFATSVQSNGRFAFNNLPTGNFVVQLTVPNRVGVGTANGSLAAGQTAEINLQLENAAAITGKAVDSDGVTPVGGADVTLHLTRPSGVLTLTTHTDAQGVWLYRNVPLGTATVTVQDVLTGRRARVSDAALTTNGQLLDVGTMVLREANGTVNGIVFNPNSQSSSGAVVRLVAANGTFDTTTTADGRFNFEAVGIGAFTLTARDAGNIWRGSVNGLISSPFAVATHDITLRALGQITGTVFQPNGTTPVAAGVSVRLVPESGGNGLTTATNAQGQYLFSDVPLGNYQVQVNNLAANTVGRANVQLTVANETRTANLTLSGLGTVTGRVLQPDGTGAANLWVSLRSLHPTLGGYFNASTDSTGAFVIAHVPVGSFTVSSADAVHQWQGATTGQILQAGQTVTADIQLASNAVNLPYPLYDANGAYFYLQSNGRAAVGLNNVYTGSTPEQEGAFLLDVYANGTPHRFTGSNLGMSSANGREIAIQQNDLAGLEVTRKIYVPQDGYFARYVELFHNPTNAPVTVDVRVLSHARNLYSYGPPRVVTTSNGDNELSVVNVANPDRWAVVDDSLDADPLTNNQTIPALGFAFDGAGAALRANAAAFTLSSPANAEYAQISYNWQNITIPAGGTTALLHFGVQQLSRAAAQAALERLTQLPPEALMGLGAPEITAIRNFNVPADGVGLVAPLTSLNGQINGRVLAGDAVTPMAGAFVRFQSRHPLFGRTHTLTAGADGAFALTSAFLPTGDTMLVPVADFTLQGVHPNTAQSTPVLNGSFAAGATVATQDVTFSGTGVLRGAVRRHNGAALTNGGRLVFNDGVTGYTVDLTTEGAFNLAGLAAGTYTLTASAQHPQGFANTGTATAVVTAEQLTTQDVVLAPTGTVNGLVETGTGAPAVNQTVTLRENNSSCTFFVCPQRVTQTAADGRFTFSEVPANTDAAAYRLAATDNVTGLTAQATFALAADQTVTQNLHLTGYGTLQLLVTYSDGSPAPTSRVELQKEVAGPDFQTVGYTNAQGLLQINGVPVGNFVVRAHHPTNTALWSDTPGRLNTAGETVSLTVALPGLGTVTGLVTRPDGTPVADAHVTLTAPAAAPRTVTTGSDGVYTFTQVTTGQAFTLRAYYPDSEIYREQANNVITAEGATLTVNLALPGLAMVRVTVLQANSNPSSGTQVYLQHSLQSGPQFIGTTDANGQIDAPNVPEGAFTVEARNNGAVLATANGTVQAADAGQVVPFTLNLPPAGTVRGTVFAGDGNTPLTQGLIVEIFDGPATTPLYQTYIYDGNYQFDNVAVGAQGFRVVAHWLGADNTTAEVTGQPNPDGSPVTAHLTLPVAVVSGAVTFGDGAPVSYPNVYAFQELDGVSQAYYASYTDGNGLYRLFGVRPGSFTLTAQDGATGLTANATGSVLQVTAPVTLNVSLPPTGTVVGSVTQHDAAGNVVNVANAYVILAAAETGFQRTTYADADGHYTFEHVALGSFTVQAEDEANNPGLRGRATGVLATAGETVNVQVMLPDTGQVTGHAYRADGVTPLTYAQVTLQAAGLVTERTVYINADGSFTFTGVPLEPFTLQLRWFDNSTETTFYGAAQGQLTTAHSTVTVNVSLWQRGAFSGTVSQSDGTPAAFATVTVFTGESYPRSVTTDADGFYSLTSVPFGLVRVTAQLQVGEEVRRGQTQTSLNGPTATVNVTLGGAYLTDCAKFDGTDGFRYDLCANGTLGSGGAVTGGPTAFVSGSGALRLNGADLPESGWATLTGNGRVVETGPVRVGQLQVARQVYVPATGGFARFLETITNPTSQPVTVKVRVEQQISAGQTARLVVAPAANGNRYAVLDSSTGAALATGFVFAGGNSATPVNTVRCAGRTPYQTFDWQITLPAGATRRLLHFAVQRDATDAASVTAQAEALANLSDSGALAGLSATERSQIVNFAAPLSLGPRRPASGGQRATTAARRPETAGRWLAGRLRAAPR